MIIDVHAHLWEGKVEQDRKEILKACELYGIDRVIVSGLFGGHYPSVDAISESNSEVFKFMQDCPDTIRGWAYINPALPNAREELLRGLFQYGMLGMKLWVATLCDDSRVFPLIEECIRHDVPVLLHSWYKSTGQLQFESTGCNVANIAKRYPEAKIIMAHLGGNCYHGIKAIRQYENVIVDISGSNCERDALDYALSIIGSDRVVFGTDMPGPFLNCIAQVDESEIGEEYKDKILYKNALRFIRGLR